MKYRAALAFAALTMILACSDDPSGLELAQFQATMQGARSLTLIGTSFGARVYSEAWQQGRYTIAMSSPEANRGRLVQIACPDTSVLQIRTYTLGPDEQGCHGVYRAVVMMPDSFHTQEEVVSSEGTMTVTAVSATAIAGTFQFAGTLRSEGQVVVPVTVSGSFNALRHQ